MAAGKRIRKAKESIEVGREYSVEEASELLAKLPAAKFDESVDLAIRLGIDPKKAEENIRGTIELPHGTGKSLRVVVFCKGDKDAEARQAGADYVGAEDLVGKIQEGWLDFDAVVAAPDVMGLVGRVGKILGPRGLMPNPKVGTVTFEIGKAVKSIKAGRIEFRAEKEGIVHLGAGRVSFGPQKIAENIRTVIESIVKVKPPTSKGIYLQSISLSSTMGPSIAISPLPFRL